MASAIEAALAANVAIHDDASRDPCERNDVPVGIRAIACDDIRRFDAEALLAHELRSRLAPMKHAADILMCESLDGVTTWQVAAIIERQVSAMTRLIDDLLNTSRARAGRLELQRSAVPLAESCKDYDR